jgi:hypothetical protein
MARHANTIARCHRPALQRREHALGMSSITALTRLRHRHLQNHTAILPLLLRCYHSRDRRLCSVCIAVTIPRPWVERPKGARDAAAVVVWMCSKPGIAFAKFGGDGASGRVEVQSAGLAFGVGVAGGASL